MNTNTISYGSVCSGIEAASVAWEVLGFSPAWFSQYDPENNYDRGPDFPSAVLAHHWPEVPNHGDMTKLWAKVVNGEIEAPDILVGGTPCFTAGHMVLTAKGYVPIENIQTGDLVISHTGTLRRVVRIGSKQAKVGVISGVGMVEGITCTGDHPFRSVSWVSQSTKRSGKYTRVEHVGLPEWTAAKDMPGLQWCSLTSVQCDLPPFPSSISEDEMMYIAGFYLGDGWVRRWSGANKKAVAFGVNEGKLGKFLARVSAHVSVTEGGTGPRITLCNTKVAEWLIEHFGEGSANKSIPAWVMAHPHRSALLSGYLDTDGHINRNGWRSISVSRRLAYGIRDLSQTLGMVASVSYTEVNPTKIIEGRTVNQRNYWTVSAFKSDTSRKSRVHHGMLLRAATSFAEAGEQTVFNIEVEGDHSYTLDGAIVHNCQAFSVAGARAGLSDQRGQLTIAYGELADAIDYRRAAAGLPPAIIVWENVPGVLSSKDNAFGAFLGLLAGEDCELQPPGKRWANAGCVLRGKRTIAWRILDAQYFGVAQRRRRVFVVASARTDIDPAQILFERDGVRRDIAPSRGAGKAVAALTANGVGTCGADDNQGQAGHLFPQCVTGNISHTLKAEGFDGSEDGTGRGTPIIAMAHGQGGAEIKTDDSAPTLTCNHEAPIVFSSNGHASFAPGVSALRAKSGADHETLAVHGTQDPDTLKNLAHTLGRNHGQENAVAYCLQHAQIGRKDSAGPQGKGWQEEVGFTLDSRADADAVAIAPAIALQTDVTPKASVELAFTLKLPSSSGGGQPAATMTPNMAVRRLTPVECERLQGFPDNHTLIPVEKRKKITADEYAYLRHHNPNMTAEQAYKLAADGPRYKAIGNSMAVPVMRWIGDRIMKAIAEAGHD